MLGKTELHHLTNNMVSDESPQLVFEIIFRFYLKYWEEKSGIYDPGF